MKEKNSIILKTVCLKIFSAILLITLNGCGGAVVRNGADVNQNLQSNPPGKWTWVSGDSDVDQYGVYGNRGVVSTTNKPGARRDGAGWADREDNLWLFGGNGYGAESSGLLNDLWKFDGVNWTWVSGDSGVDQRGVYGDKGIPAVTNKPGARRGSISWTDSKGNLWLFGGYGYADTGFLGLLNDLWKFDGTSWTWISGDNKVDHSGDYGSKGVASATNKPGARQGSVSWADSKGSMWMFGGIGYAGTGLSGILNDLWRFDGINWTWISGDSRQNEIGIYGARGVADKANKPGGRYSSVSWIDSEDNLWLFGGYGINDFRIADILNDLWKFDGVSWTWVSGDKTQDRRGVYGTRGISSGSNKPGSRYGGIGWTDSEDNLWLFGGLGTGSISSTLFNDLWKFDGNNWAWISGDTRARPGTYGSKGVAHAGNQPGARNESTGWTDSKGNFWLFGGCKINDCFNDLWKYEP